MLTTKTLAIAVIAAAMIFSIAPSLVNSASASITQTCTNRGGHSSTGPCAGNTEHNGKICVARNPAGKAPPGQNPC